MTIEQLEKAKSILEDLREYREFLKEYDKSHDKVITVKKSFLSSFKSTFDFSKDAHLKKVIREHIVSQIEDLEKQQGALTEYEEQIITKQILEKKIDLLKEEVKKMKSSLDLEQKQIYKFFKYISLFNKFDNNIIILKKIFYLLNKNIF